jgi:RNA polymerase sigma-70 factor (family 1)
MKRRDFATLSDDELLQQLESGADTAFIEIYNRYWEKLLAIGYYHTQDKQAAEDIVQEVLVGLWDRRNDLKINVLEAYLATAVRFAVFKAIARDRRKRELLAGKELAAHSWNLEEKLEARFLEEYLRGVVEQLPEQARLVFTYRRQEELTIAEIAGKLDLSPKAVEYHMTKALRALKQAVQKIKLFFV